MRKFYSNLMQGTLSLALVALVCAQSTAQCDIPAPDKSVWGTQFDGGLDGWTALDADFNERKRADGTDIGWEWSADGSVESGAYSGGVMESASVCNGAVTYNSDFLDNAGTQGNFGNGDCAAPCGGILLSPTIDLSEVEGDNFVLQFSSRHRQFQSDFNVLLSLDDGETWIDTASVFGDNYPETILNGPALNINDWRIPLCDLGKDREVRIAFWYSGNYYHWSVDDVHIIAEDLPDMRPNENWFAASLTDGIPYDQAYPLAFLADIENRSSISSEGSTLAVAVTDQTGAVKHEQTLDYNAVAGCSLDENKSFSELYDARQETIAAGDVWNVAYTITDEVADADMSNNIIESSINWTENEWRAVTPEEEAGGNYLGGTKFAGEHLTESWGRQFYVNNGTRDGQQLVLDRVDFGFVVGQGGDIDQVSIVVSVYEWFDSNNDGVVDAAPSNEKIKLGSAPTIFGGTLANTRAVSVFPVDENDAPIVLESGRHYIAMVHYQSFTSSTTIFPLMADFGYTEFAHGGLETAYEAFYENSPEGVEVSALRGNLGGIGVTAQDADEDRVYLESMFILILLQD